MFRLLLHPWSVQAIYKEIKNIAEMEFRYMEPSKPDSFCCLVARNMLQYSGEHGARPFLQHQPQFHHEPNKDAPASLGRDRSSARVDDELAGFC